MIRDVRAAVIQWLVAVLAIAYFAYMAVVVNEQATECRDSGGVWQIKLIRCDYPERPTEDDQGKSIPRNLDHGPRMDDTRRGPHPQRST